VEFNIGSKNTTQKIEVKEGGTVIINPQQFNTVSEKKQLKQIISSAPKEGYLFVEEQSKQLIEDFKRKDIAKETQDILNFLKDKIPIRDISIWRAALYVRQCYLEKKDVAQLKEDIVKKYGVYGANITNLCTAEYFSDLFKPLYEKLCDSAKDEPQAKKYFKEFYIKFVTEEPSTIFVHKYMTPAKLKEEIEKKIQYGTRLLRIHGIGDKNVQKIKVSIKEIEGTYKNKITGIHQDLESNKVITITFTFSK